MENNHQVQEHSKVSIEKIIDSIRESRDNLISGFLLGSTLVPFLEQNFNIAALSPIKLEFLKRDLKELQISTLDLVHYSSLIKQMKDVNTYLPVADHPLVLQEIRSVFQKYCS
jgi:hypothetical protein